MTMIRIFLRRLLWMISEHFGMIPEFIGRLPIIFTMNGLTEDMMVTDPASEPKKCDP